MSKNEQQFELLITPKLRVLRRFKQYNYKVNKEKVIIGGCGHARLPFGKVRDQLKMVLFHINNFLNQLLRPQVSKDKWFFNKVSPHNSDLISK